MRYRSSVSAFVRAVLCDAAAQKSDYISALKNEMSQHTDFRDILDKYLPGPGGAFLSEARAMIPEEDWDEILAYICRFHEAYGFQPPICSRQREAYLFLPWVAAVAVCALDDIGRL